MFLGTKGDRYNFFLYLYGDEVSLNSKALPIIIARDGAIVPSPEIYINGRKNESSLIDLKPDMREISVKVGDFESVFPLSYKMLENAGTPEKKFIQFSDNEIKKAPVATLMGGKTIFLLPDQFRAVPEFELNMHLFCLENGQPCADNMISINGFEIKMNGGYSRFKSVYTVQNTTFIVFSDGSSVSAEVPYTGKMLQFFKRNGRIFIAALTEMRNVYIDCYRNNKWLGTDIIKISTEGTELPASYLNCDTVQASLNSASPGSTFTVITEVSEILAPVTDPYYAPLAQKINRFEPSIQKIFIKSYNSSFFRVLPVMFSGEKLETEFNIRHQKMLELLWWMIFALSVAGLILFIVVTLRKLKVVEGIDGELVTYSMNRQRAVLFIACILYIMVFVFLLYLLKNLA